MDAPPLLTRCGHAARTVTKRRSSSLRMVKAQSAGAASVRASGAGRLDRDRDGRLVAGCARADGRFCRAWTSAELSQPVSANWGWLRSGREPSVRVCAVDQAREN
jgi:hypothetical protein